MGWILWLGVLSSKLFSNENWVPWDALLSSREISRPARPSGIRAIQRLDSPVRAGRRPFNKARASSVVRGTTRTIHGTPVLVTEESPQREITGTAVRPAT